MIISLGVLACAVKNRALSLLFVMVMADCMWPLVVGWR